LPSATPPAPAVGPSVAPPSAHETPVAPPPTPATAAPPVQGWLLVLLKPWADVTVDGRTLGATPLDRIPLSPGSHAVILTHPRYAPFTQRVEIRAGETTTIQLDLAAVGKRR
jgi:serine/threonine-protein kinase